MPRVTPLYSTYRFHSRATEFAGYTMPLMFKGIIQEHLAVRERAGIFDVSHMGRFMVEGRDAERFLNHLVTVDVARAEAGRAQYTFLCHEGGGVMDDLITYKLGSDRFMVVVNAANREKDFEWISRWMAGMDVTLKDVTDDSVLIAVQGPRSADLVKEALGLEVSGIRRFRFVLASYGGLEVVVSRTGYTGEDGFEMAVMGVSLQRPQVGMEMWDALLEKGRRWGVEPCGLGARDTLRIEAGLPLYGNELAQEFTPVEAKLDRFLDMSKFDYIGKPVHERQLKEGTAKTLVGLVCIGNAVPRSHYGVFLGGRQVGFVTSGTFSPILRKGIAMAYVDSNVAKEEKELEVDVRGIKCKAEIHPPPFYDPRRYGWRRTS